MSVYARTRVTVVVLLVLTACASADAGDRPGATDLEAVSASATAIRSGNLLLSFTMTDERSGTDVGFTISGPFSLGSDEAPPAADLTFEQVAGSQTTTSRFVLSEGDAYVVLDERAYELPPERADALSAFAQPAEGGPLGSLALERWITDPRVTGEGSIGGEPTDIITGEVRAVDTIAGITSLIANAGAADVVPALPTEDRERLENAVRSSKLELEVGRDDGILRRLDVDILLAPPDPAFAELAAARLRFEVRIERPNDAVTVTAPSPIQPSTPS